MSEAGRLMTSRHCLASLCRLGERLDEREVSLEAPSRQVALIVKLSRVGHPLVDQNQAWSVRVHQLAQHVARAGGPLVVGLDALEGFLGLLGPTGGEAELPRQLAPQRAHHRAVGLGHRVARRDLVAHQHDALDRRELGDLGLLQHRVDAEQLAGGGPGEEVVEREHGVGLAAAEVGLELHHRVAAVAGEPAHRADQQALQALGEIGAAEELDRLPVLVRPLAQVHLPEVRRELGLLVAATRHVPVRADHLPPGLEVGRGLALDGGPGALPLLAAHLLVEAQAQQLHLHLLDLVRLRCRDGGQEPAGRVEGAVGVVGGEGLLVRPAVAHVAQLAHERPLGLAERLAEHVVPRLPHQA